MITNAYTCTGPYAILIMLGIKRVENRNMMPSPAVGRNAPWPCGSGKKYKKGCGKLQAAKVEMVDGLGGAL